MFNNVESTLWKEAPNFWWYRSTFAKSLAVVCSFKLQREAELNCAFEILKREKNMELFNIYQIAGSPGDCIIIIILFIVQHNTIGLIIAKNIFVSICVDIFYICVDIYKSIWLQVPLEIVWTATVSWEADDTTCRIMVFFRSHFLRHNFPQVTISLSQNLSGHNLFF